MSTENCSIILAAGEGKRMKSNSPKVLSLVLFKPMLQWVLDAAQKAGIQHTCVVAGYKHEILENYLSQINHNYTNPVESVLQSERKGTGHAVMMADDFLNRHRGGNVLILNGDAPFIDSAVIKSALNEHIEQDNSVTVISSVLDNPTGYGRIVRDKTTHLISAIVEQKDADEETQAILEVNSGAYWFKVDDLLSVLYNIKNNNAQGEYYLPDAIKLLIAIGKKAAAYTTADANTVLGANDCLQLSALNSIARNHILSELMFSGIEIPCHDGVIVGPDVKFHGHSSILPGSILIGKTEIGKNCVIGPNAYVKNSIIEDDVTLNSVQCNDCTIKSSQSLSPFSVIDSNNIQKSNSKLLP